MNYQINSRYTPRVEVYSSRSIESHGFLINFSRAIPAPQQNAEYPQQNPGYLQQNQEYPQQNSGYPGQNPGYPQQNTGNTGVKSLFENNWVLH